MKSQKCIKTFALYLNLFFMVQVALIKSDENLKRNGIKIGFILHDEESALIQRIQSIFKRINDKVQDDGKLEFIFIEVSPQQTELLHNKICDVLNEGVTFIIDVTPGQSNFFLSQLKDIRYLHVESFLHPFLNLIEQFLQLKEVQDAVFIFETSHQIKEALYYTIQHSRLHLSLLANTYNLTDQFQSLRPRPRNYVIFGEMNSLLSIFNKIRWAGLLQPIQQWHLISLNSINSFDNIDLDGFNFTLVFLNNRIPCVFEEPCELCILGHHRIHYLTFMIDEIITKLLEILAQIDFQTKNWSCWNDSIANPETHLSKINTGKLIREKLSQSKFLLVDSTSIRLKLNASIIVHKENRRSQKIAEWQNETLKLISYKEETQKRFFRIGTVEAIPWSFKLYKDVKNKENSDNDKYLAWHGYCIELIELISKKLSFDYEIVTPTQGTFGNKLQNGSWDGLIGDLITGEIDIAVAALKVTGEREEVIDFVLPYFQKTGISIVMRKEVKQTSLFKFMTVFKLEVWLSILALITITAIIIWILDMYSPYSARNNEKLYPYICRNFSLKESFWFALTSFTPQGGGEIPKAISARILVASYWVFVVLMLATFTANLATFLTVERMQTPVQSLEQLGRQSRINYTVVQGSDTHIHFINMKFAEDTIFKLWKELTLNSSADNSNLRIWEYPFKEQYGTILMAINASNPVKNAAEGFQKVNLNENADFAFIHDSAAIKYEITKNCNLTEVGEEFAEQPYAIAIQQGSNLQDEISHALLELNQERFLETLSHKYWNSSGSQCGEIYNEEGITLKSLGGVFIATLCGLLLSMIILVAEIIYYRRRNKIIIDSSQAKKSLGFQLKNSSKPPIKKQVTIVREFVPVKRKNCKTSVNSMIAKNSDCSENLYFE